MITDLHGTIEDLLPTKLTIRVHDIGYEVLIPLSTFKSLENHNQSFSRKLFTHQVIREDAHLLFGFNSEEERGLFKLLLNNVSGVGPKLALAILSGISIPNFKTAVISGDTLQLSKISGVGKKTAERIILELKDKVGVVETWSQQAKEDSKETQALLALIGLGYKREEAKKAVEIASKENPTEVGELVKIAITKLL
jgi:Holliday junction DNA helicase RuvA